MKKLLISLCLLILLGASCITVIALYISGPSIKYDSEINQQKEAIQQKEKETFISLDRHVFRYITYVAKTTNEYIWYDSEAKELLRRKSDKVNFELAKAKVAETHKLEDLRVSLGYGYEQGVYIVENSEYVVLLDIDSLKEIYYQRR